jgi:hypothetical protein
VQKGRHTSVRWWLSNGLIFTVIALYLAAIVVREALEGHVSSSRSVLASVVIGALALLAGWRAFHSWRRVVRRRT